MYRKHFIKEHVPQVEKEVACLIDLCGKIAISTKAVDLDRANKLSEDMLKSLQTINDMYAVKKQRDENRSEQIRRYMF